MARDGSGGYSLPYPTFTNGTTADGDQVTANNTDIAVAIAASIAKDGQTTPTANLPMGNFKHTGVADATARTHYAAAGQVQDSAFTWCGTAGGTKNALTLSPTPAITAYAAGQTFRFISGGTASDDAVTVAISGLTTKAVQFSGSALSSSSTILASKLYEIVYDGTAFQIIKAWALAPGDVVGPSSSTDNALVRYDGTTGKLIQDNTSWTLADDGTLNATDEILQRPVLKDYGESVNAIGGTGGGTQDIDLTLGNVVTATVDTSANTFTFSNPSASGTACSFTLILTNGGSQTVNWPASVDWAGGTAPTLTAAGVDVLTFVTVDGGTIWYGFAAGIAMA